MITSSTAARSCSTWPRRPASSCRTTHWRHVRGCIRGRCSWPRASWPYSGQCVHFKHSAPEPKAYAVNRYDFEAWRHWGIVDAQLAKHPYMLGERYTLVDMAVWGWARVIPFVLGQEAWAKLPQVKRLLDEINARPAAQRAEGLKTKHSFKTEMDEDARKAMFPQNARLGG